MERRFDELLARAETVGVPPSELDALTDQLASGATDLAQAADDLEQLSVGYYLVGQRVRVRGLAAKPEVNGRVGSVSSFVTERGRCVVHFDTNDDAPMMLRPANLLPTKDTAWAVHDADQDKQPT